MLKLAKGTRILGLTKTGSHRMKSQYIFVVVIFGSYPEKGFTNDPPNRNGKKKSKELSEQIYGKLFTQIFVHFARLITHHSRDPLPKINIKARKKPLLCMKLLNSDLAGAKL